VGKLEYRFTNDVLFKLLFVRNPDLLKNLVAAMLRIEPKSIKRFRITNSEMPPAGSIDEKFCRLDINMVVNGRRINLEVQVDDEGDYPERSLYYWARSYSTSLGAGKRYAALPHTIHISILAFDLFNCKEFHSEFRPLEVTRGTRLTDKMCLHYFELNKLPKTDDADDMLKLWLSLFKAETEEELKKIEKIGGTTMKQAICAYRSVTATEEFKELERLRDRTKRNEASALYNARRKEREIWQGVVAEHVAELKTKDAIIAELMAKLGMRV